MITSCSVKGHEYKIKVKGKGDHLKLVINNDSISEFERNILEQSKRVDIKSLPFYRPNVTTGDVLKFFESLLK